MITTIAGTGTAGYSGDYGAAADAEINSPVTFALDAAGDLFFCDAGNNVVREVNTATGQITTVAGDGVAGDSGDGGLATAAELSTPQGVAVNSAGTELFIADSGNNVIREVDLTTGTITTIAGDYAEGGHWNGDGPATTTELNDPQGLALDGSEFIFADNSSNLIREVDLNPTSPTVTTIAGNYNGGYGGDADGPATDALFSNPTDVAIDSSGNIFVADYFNNAIREITGLGADPQVTTIAGNGGQSFNGDNQPPTQASLYYPEGVAVDNNDDVLVADSGNCRIRLITGLAAGSPTITTLAGDGNWNSSGDGGLAADSELDGPGGVAVDPSGDHVYIADSAAHRVREVANNLAEISGVPSGPVAQGTPVTLDGGVMGDPGQSPSYAWTVTDGNGNPVASGDNTDCTFTPAAGGSYTVQLVVTNGGVASGPRWRPLTWRATSASPPRPERPPRANRSRSMRRCRAPRVRSVFRITACRFQAAPLRWQRRGPGR